MRKDFMVCVFLLLSATWLFVPMVLAEEGVTDTEIHIAQFGPLTGPALAWGDVLRGTGLKFRSVNEEEGGVHGRKIVYHTFDDGYNPAKTKYGVKQLQTSVGIFAWVGGIGTSTGLAVKDYLMNRKIPWFGPFSGSKVWITPPEKYLFAMYTHYELEAQVLCRYSVRTLNKKRVAILYQNDGFGESGLRGAREELEKHGMELIRAISVDKRDASELKVHTLELRKAGADAVLLWLTPFQGLRILKIAETMKFDPQWLGGSSFSDFIKMYEMSNGLIEGVIASTFTYLDPEHPLVRKYHAMVRKYGTPGQEYGVFHQAGVSMAEPVVEALKRSGRGLTRERFVAELENMREFEGLSGKISYEPFDPDKPGCRMGQNKAFLLQCLKGGEIKILTDWMGE